MELRPKGMLTSVETCLKLKISIGTFNKYIKLNIIKSRVKVGRIYFYNLKTVQKELQTWLDNQTI